MIPGVPESYTPEFWSALEQGADPGTAISLARAALQFRGGGFPGGAGAGFTRPQTGNRGQGGAGSDPGNTPRVGNPGERYAFGMPTGTDPRGQIPREGPGQVDPRAIDGGMATLPFIPPGPNVPFFPVGGNPGGSPGFSDDPRRFIGIPDFPIPYDFFTEAIPQRGEANPGNPGTRLPHRPVMREPMMAY